MKTCANCRGPISSHPRAVYCTEPDCRRRANRERMRRFYANHKARTGASYMTLMASDERRQKDAEAARRRGWTEAKRAAYERRRALKAGATVENFTNAEIFERDGWTCGICETPVDPALAYPDPMSASLDHVVPLSLGGDHSRANTRCSHLTCNIRRGNRAA